LTNSLFEPIAIALYRITATVFQIIYCGIQLQPIPTLAAMNVNSQRHDAFLDQLRKFGRAEADISRRAILRKQARGVGRMILQLLGRDTTPHTARAAKNKKPPNAFALAAFDPTIREM
jgi:hypothetical protein